MAIEYDKRVDPETAIKAVKAATGVKLFVSAGVELVTEVNEENSTIRHYPGWACAGNVSVTKPAALKMLASIADFNRRKKEQGQATGTVRLSLQGRCLFIH